MFKKINRNSQQRQQSNITPCTMEPMEDRLLMASDYLRPGAYEPTTTTTGSTVTFTFTVTNPAPTTGILIGLLLPAVQKMPG